MPPDQLGLLPAWLSARARLLPRGRVRVLRDCQSLELNLNVLGGAAGFQGRVVVVLLVAQNVTLSETVWETRQARGRVFQGVLPAPRRVAAAALGAAAQAAVVGVQRAALAGLAGPLAAGVLEDPQGPGRSCEEKSTFPLMREKQTPRCEISAL